MSAGRHFRIAPFASADFAAWRNRLGRSPPYFGSIGLEEEEPDDDDEGDESVGTEGCHMLTCIKI